MKKGLKGVITIVFLGAFVAMLLAGCGDFREQALEAQSRIDEALRRAEIAEDAASRNAGLIINLEHRIEALEVSLAELQVSAPSN